MSTTPHVTPMVFRVQEGTVFALMPTIPTDYEGKLCSCYQHVGQHSSADYHECIRASRPAREGEYRDLHAELSRCGYSMDVIGRATRAHHDERRATAARIKARRAAIRNPEPAAHDLVVANHGSICIVTPLTAQAREWVASHIQSDELQWFGGGFVVEPRYLDDMIAGAQADGLEVG